MRTHLLRLVGTSKSMGKNQKADRITMTTSRDELAPLLNRTKSGEDDFVISEN